MRRNSFKLRLQRDLPVRFFRPLGRKPNCWIRIFSLLSRTCQCKSEMNFYERNNYCRESSKAMSDSVLEVEMNERCVTQGNTQGWWGYRSLDYGYILRKVETFCSFRTSDLSCHTIKNETTNTRATSIVSSTRLPLLLFLFPFFLLFFLCLFRSLL